VTGTLIGCFSGGTLLLLIVVMLVTYMGCQDLVNARYPAIKATLESSRDKALDPLERVAIQKQVMDINSEIKSCQYWNTTSFDPIYPDKIMQLELLK
jgi:hypothetical protein